MDPLAVSYTVPLEREYEAWCVAAMERYFENTGISYHLWAVSPATERTWPADEALSVGMKLIGFQFKQAHLAPLKKGQTTIAYDRLCWHLHQPAGQMALVRSHSEIFYALPTFTNRQLRRCALNHCLFWRPPNADANVWYDNTDPRVRTPNNKLTRDPAARRWGGLMEAVLGCWEGSTIEHATTISSISERYLLALEEAVGSEGEGEQAEPAFTLYLLAIQI